MSPADALAVIWRTLTIAQRRRFVMYQFVSLFMAVSTVAGLAAVMTFLAVLANPTLIETNVVLHGLWRATDATRQDFIRMLSAAFIALLIVSAILNIAGSRVMGSFAHGVGDRIRAVLFAEYLQRDYLFHARAGAGRLIDNVLNNTDRMTVTLLHGQQFVTNAVLTLLVVTSIAVVNPAVALVGVVGIGGGYVLFYRLVRRRIGRHGKLLTRLSSERVAIVEQSFLGIKYLLVSGTKATFVRRLDAVTRALSRSIAETQFVAQMPRYVLECLAGAALIACAALVSGGVNDGLWLAQLSFIGFAGFRLLPAFQQMYHALVVMRANRAAIEEIAAELAGSSRIQTSQSAREITGTPLMHGIELSELSFRYSPEAPLILDNVSMTIESGSAIGIVGASGCGKTTLVDLILGLLQPVSGRIELDGKLLDSSSLPAWRRCVGYVPQDVIILDATVRENVAFGVDPAEIDDARVREVLSQAGASDFIDAMASGQDAGILGGSLSGGQRQRIGIARALYHEPSLLVLDEATNSLDADTERAIIETAIRNRGTKTLLIVAHGFAMIDACDRVYELRGGTLHERGPAVARNRALRAQRGIE